MKIECSLESHTGGWGAEVGPQFLERGEGEGFVLGLGGGGLALSCAPSARTWTAPPAGRAGRQPVDRTPGGCRHLEGVCGHPASEPRGRCSRAGRNRLA